jgi:hypothetical protein
LPGTSTVACLRCYRLRLLGADPISAFEERTPWLFGNRGKKLPDHTLFGQSFGDLDGYTADRERACAEIGSCKAAIAEIAGRQKTNWTLNQENEANRIRVF